VSNALSEYEPNIVIGPAPAEDTKSNQITVYLSRQFSGGREKLYAVPWPEQRIREGVKAIKASERNVTTQRAVWIAPAWPLADAAE
jgi:hypothetical protein